MAEGNGNNRNRSLSASTESTNRNPWNIARHLPDSNETEELRRCFNLVWKEFYGIEQTATTIAQQVLNTASAGNSASFAAGAPAWVYSFAPPFGIIACNPDGSTMVDSRGYGIIQKVL